jgi:hypothetical protein
MFDRLGRAWRVVATAFCFAIFGIGAWCWAFWYSRCSR